MNVRKINLRDVCTRLAMTLAIAAPLGLARAADLSQTTLSNVALFNRCYAQITGKRLPRLHPLRAAVAAGTRSPVDACMDVLDSGLLVPSGGSEGLLRADVQSLDARTRAEARAVIQNFNDVHRLWFPNDNLPASIPMGCGDFGKTRELHDETESALHVTRALFTDGVKYAELATGTSGVEALRTGGERSDTIEWDSDTDMFVPRTDANRISHSTDPTRSSGSMVLGAPVVQTGDLIGIRRLDRNPAKIGVALNHIVGPYVSTVARPNGEYFQPNVPLTINRSIGGGILGTASYLLLNLGRPDNMPADGGIRMGRRWSKAAMADLLCRDMPAIRLSDAVPFVQRTATETTPPFRTSRNCMGCHATMDPLASVIRHVSYGSSINTIQPMIWTAAQVAPLPREIGMVNLDPEFFRRPTNGRVFYRSHDGTLVNQEAPSLARVGEIFAAGEDLYVCAASRYFQYFTGIQVSLQDIGDESATPLSDADLAYRKEVVRIGLALKNDAGQSLRGVIRNILSSPLYRTRSMRLPGSAP